MDIGRGLLHGFYRCLAQGLVRWECVKSRVWDFSFRKADGFHGEIVLHRVNRYDDIADVDLIVQRTRNARVDDLGATEIVDQRIRANAGVDLSHAALDNDDIFPFQRALAEFHSGDDGCLFDIGFLF